MVGRAAFRAFALDVAVGQEHVLHGVEELLDGAARNQLVLAQRAVDVFGELMVLGRVGRVPVVEADVKPVQILTPPGGDRRDADRPPLLGLQRPGLSGAAHPVLEERLDDGRPAICHRLWRGKFQRGCAVHKPGAGRRIAIGGATASRVRHWSAGLFSFLHRYGGTGLRTRHYPGNFA